MAVLTSEKGQEAYKLTRNTRTNLATLNVTLKHPPNIYKVVKVFNIESNGWTGSQAVPGELLICLTSEMAGNNNN